MDFISWLWKLRKHQVRRATIVNNDVNINATFWETRKETENEIHLLENRRYESGKLKVPLDCTY